MSRNRRESMPAHSLLTHHVNCRPGASSLESKTETTLSSRQQSMPLYEYQCKKCHHRFEKIQKFSDPHVKKCPDCGGPVEQVTSAPDVQLKGSGWYVADYRGKSSGTAERAASGSSANG